MESLAGDGFIGALLPVPVSAEPEWVRADGSMKDTEEVGCWPTPSSKTNVRATFEKKYWMTILFCFLDTAV